MTTTPNLGLTYLVSGQLQPEVVVNADLNILDSMSGALLVAFGNEPATTTGLTYGYYGATLYRSGAPVTIAAGTIGMTASATNYVQRTVQGVVSVNTTGYLTGNIPMATVVTGSTAITTITDTRPAGYDLTGRAVVEIGAPTGLALTTATTGGTIAASTDCTYRISAVYPWGESAASAEVSITTGGSTATNENTLTWAALPAGATSGNIYGRTAGGELLIANVLAGTLTYTDTGSVTPAGALPTGTLTLTPEQYNFGIVSLQGALGGNSSVVFPATAQQWLASNDTTGAFTVSAEVSGQATPIILVPGAQTVYSNGTDMVSGAGAVTLGSADVIGALGYTPVNNALGYVWPTSQVFNGAVTFGSTITQTPTMGANNQTPFLQAGDFTSDYIVNGLILSVPSPASLTASMPAGKAYVLSQRTVLPADDTNTYAPSTDTYVDFSYNGVLTYSAVANGATAPAVAANSLRLTKVVTSPIISPTPRLAFSSAAGTLAAGTYSYQLVAHDATGYGLPSAEVSITTTATGEVVLTWTSPLNETGMDVYGRVAGSIGLLASGITGTTWTDTGAATVGAAPPATATSNAIQSAIPIASMHPSATFQNLNAMGGGNQITNLAIGAQALYSNTTGGSNVANGVLALFSNTTGSNNVAFGYYSGSNLTTGFNNTILGSNAKILNPTDDNSIVIGYAETGNGPHTATIGGSAGLLARGPIFATGASVGALSVGSTTTAGANTLSAAQLVAGYFADGATQTAAFTITTDTAANILAALPLARVGTGIRFRFINNDQSSTGYAGTLAGGTGVTIATTPLPNPPVPKGGFMDYLFVFTSIGTSPALTVYSVGGNSAGLL